MSLLQISNLHVRYGGIAALRGVNLTLEAGATLMIAGPNGAGKSTLSKAIAGLVKPHNGQIVFDGKAIGGRPPEVIARYGCSMVPEGRQVFGSMSVLENLNVASGMRRDRRAVADDQAYLFEVFPLLADRRHAQAGLLSGGQQQMLAIARGLMTHPKLLAIDEPSLGLAPNIIDQVYDSLQRLRRERQIALVLVEQSSARAAMMGGRMILLRNGRVAFDGDARTTPAHVLHEAYFGLAGADAPGESPLS